MKPCYCINPDSEMLVEQIRYPTKNNLYPQVCRGWWEEQDIIDALRQASGKYDLADFDATILSFTVATPSIDDNSSLGNVGGLEYK